MMGGKRPKARWRRPGHAAAELPSLPARRANAAQPGDVLVAFPVAGLADAGIAAVLLAALVAAPLAPLVALGLACFAENKVQRLAQAHKVAYSASQRANLLTATCMAGVSG
jgi:hypothetical protein